MRRRGWLALLLLAPFAVIVIGIQVALSMAAVGAIQAAVGVQTQSLGLLEGGAAKIAEATGVLEWVWSSPPADLLATNPVALGAVDDTRQASIAVASATTLLDPLVDMAAMAKGLDGRPPLIKGTTIDVTRIPEVGPPLAAVDSALVGTATALDQVPGTGPIGHPIGRITESVGSAATDLHRFTAAGLVALPGMPEALGATEPKRYLVCALNDAEIFASGGAPLSAVMVQAARGTISAPISGQLESKLSPGNPTIVWEHQAGPPWLRSYKRYPFVNSNFHPDFRTAAGDMRRAWASLGYPVVDGVITVDLNALAQILAWAGPVHSDGHGGISQDNLIRTVLVDSYREFDSPQGVIERHAQNDQLASDLTEHFTEPWNVVPAMRGALRAMPQRHIQASFDAEALEAAAASLQVQAGLAEGRGDMLGAFSQSGPNKLSVFQQRRITQEVRLDAHGGARITRTIEITNAVPGDVSGKPTDTRGYTALRARMRVAHRIPLAAVEPTISTGTSPWLVPLDRTGPFPDDRGGQVMWQGHESAPGATATMTMTYRLPAGTFQPGTYELWADPQALTIPAELVVKVIPDPGSAITLGTSGAAADWAVGAGHELTWRGPLLQQLHLELG